MIRADLRADSYRCRRCSAPLANAPEIRRTWRKIRAGGWAGDRGEFALVRCPCGEKRRILWNVTMSPYRAGAQ